MSNREDKFTQSAIITPSRHIYKYQIPTAEKFVNFLDEVELISRTNEYRPYDAYEDSRRTDLPVDLRELHVEEFHTLVEEDCYDNIRLMKYDPLRGNHLSIAGYKEDQFYLFSTGDVLSTLVIASSRKKKYDIDDTTVELPLNRLNILYTEDMTRSIKQTVISPFQSSHEVVFGVRTSSSIHIREYNKRSRTMRKIHDYILPEESIGNPFIDYSMPCSLVLSPFDEYQYLISTNNGYTALIDGLNESVLFENKIPEIYDKEYQSRWVSSNFGRGLHSYYIATEKYIKQWSTTNSHVKSKTLVTSKDKIIAFTSTRSDLIAYSTINETKVINVIHPNQPIVSWIHKMGEGAIHISLDDLSDNRWRVVVSSILTQRVDFIEFVYQKDIDVM
ncbi:hypothetical protein BDB01DRAFT_5435 [Pilobolus umbonatus]|nr:hypothetical protein BDB01DRAFT_5435 [Pilobolus umbonatus]